MTDRQEVLREKIRELDACPEGEIHLITLLERYVEQHPDEFYFVVRYAESLRSIGRYTDAARTLRSAWGIATDRNVRSTIALGFAQALEPTSREEVESWYAKFVELRKNPPGYVWILRGTNLSVLEKFDPAIECYQAALVSPESDCDEALRNIALIHRARGEYEQAREFLERAQRLGPSERIAAELLGLEGLEGTSEFASSVTGREILHAKIRELNRKPPEFKPHVIVLLEKYAAEHLDDIFAVSRYADALRMVGRRSDATGILSRLWAISEHRQDRAWIASRLALANAEIAPAEADQWYAQFLELSEHPRAWAWIDRGDNLAKLERFDAALGCYESALEALEPNVGEILQRFARVYRAKGDYAQARSFLSRARMAAPSKKIDAMIEGLDRLDDTRKFVESLIVSSTSRNPS